MTTIYGMKQTIRNPRTIGIAFLSALLLPLLMPGGLLQPREAAAATISCSSGVSGCHFPVVKDGTGRNVPDGRFTGSHARHAGYSTSSAKREYAYACTKCHYNHTTNNHQTGFKNITGSSLPGASYSRGKSISVAQSALGQTPTFGNCGNIYCHSNGRGVGMGTKQYSSARWGGGENCLGCHGGFNGANRSRSVGGFTLSTSHSQHLKYGATNMSCNLCHARTATSATALKSYSAAKYHVNGKPDVLFVNPSYASYTSYELTGANAGKCTNTSCHGGKSRGSWSATTDNTNHQCTHCHGQPSGVGSALPNNKANRKFFAPGYKLNGVPGTSTDQINSSADKRVGAHFKHLSSAYMTNVKCNECHSVPETPFGGGNHTLNNPRYNSGTLTFSQASTANKNTTTPAYVNGTATAVAQCTTLYCHGSNMPKGDTGGTTRQPYWNVSSMVNYSGPGNPCGVCHGNPPTAGTSASKHSGVVATTGCSTCHTQTVNASGKIINKAKHINGIVEAASHDWPYPGATHMNDAAALAGNPYTGCTSCHTNGLSNTYSYPFTRGDAALVSCYACHKNSANFNSVNHGCGDCHGANGSTSNGRPSLNAAIGNVFPNVSGSHGKHVVDLGYACSVCHGAYGTNSVNHGSSGGNVSSQTVAFVHVTSTTKQFGDFSFTKKDRVTAGKGTCANNACHGLAEWGVDKLDCVSCHTATVAIKHGPLTDLSSRRAIQPEFAATWSHKRAGGKVVNKYDCCVCHMEGTTLSGTSNPTYHADGFVNLRNADTGTEIVNVTFSGTPGSYADAAGNASFARFSRNLGSNVIEPTVAAIQMKHCLTCHDTDGATNANAYVPIASGAQGSSTRPFGYSVASTGNTTSSQYIAAGNTSGAVMDVKSQFDSGNASYHPVTAKQNNSFIKNARLKAPWNTLSPDKTAASGGTTEWGFLISCWDCHASSTDAFGNQTVQLSSVTAHGNNTTLRFGALFSNTNNFCIGCHTDNYGTASAANHATGSAFGTGGSASRYTIGMCQTCHGSSYNVRPLRGVDAHGFNRWAGIRDSTATGDTPANSLTAGAAANGNRPYGFIRPATMTNVNPAAVTETTWAPVGNKPGCVNNDSTVPFSDCSNNHNTIGPGGRY